MFNDSPDIIIFALITAFLLYKLYSVFGQQNDIGSVAKLAKIVTNHDPKPVKDPQELDNILVIDGLDQQSTDYLMKMSLIDKQFSAKTFCNSAEGAFEMIVNAYDKGDKDTLKNLVSKGVLKQFTDTMEQNKMKQLIAANTLIAITSCKIIAAELENMTAKITVRYNSQQIHLVKNIQGDIIEGDPSQIDNVEDVWVYVRNLSSSNPNWFLTETK